MKRNLLFVPIIGSVSGFMLKASVRRLASPWIRGVCELKALAVNPLEEFQTVDMDRVKDCAEHFGKCSVKELEHLRSSKFDT
jgi:hypothetical protein